MPQMLSMNNGIPETLLSPKDFEDLIDKHMGMDSANYYQNQIEHLSQCIRDLLGELEEDIDLRPDVEEVLRQYGY